MITEAENFKIIKEIKIILKVNLLLLMDFLMIRLKVEKVEFIGVRVSLLTELPSLNNLTLMPPRATFSKTKPNRIKEPIFAIESFIAASAIGSSARIN